MIKVNTASRRISVNYWEKIVNPICGYEDGEMSEMTLPSRHRIRKANLEVWGKARSSRSRRVSIVLRVDGEDNLWFFSNCRDRETDPELWRERQGSPSRRHCTLFWTAHLTFQWQRFLFKLSLTWSCVSLTRPTTSPMWKLLVFFVIFNNNLL